jgi:hypothetical protein
MLCYGDKDVASSPFRLLSRLRRDIINLLFGMDGEKIYLPETCIEPHLHGRTPNHLRVHFPPESLLISPRATQTHTRS